MRRLSLLLLLLFVARAEAITFEEFKAIAEELAPKVNPFRDAGAQDPSAEFFGGTTRDYLYWLKGQLAKGVTPAELRAMKIIDVRDFIIGDSDIDIITEKSLGLSAETFGVKKIDYVKLMPDEVRQGYIPAEKIRLSR